MVLEGMETAREDMVDLKVEEEGVTVRIMVVEKAVDTARKAGGVDRDQIVVIEEDRMIEVDQEEG